MNRYAIIGFGGLGKLHLSNLLKFERERGDIHLAAVCGADPAAFRENVKLNLGEVDISAFDFSNCAFYSDYRELIEKEHPDFIISTLPTYMHAEVAIYALERGIHVFSEKPMALTVEDCRKMIEAKNKSGKTLMIGQCLRFDPAYKKIKEYVDEKPFGKIYRAEFSRYSKKPNWTWRNWILDPKQSGGCILDMHIHDVDLINWIFGKPSSLRSAMTEAKVEREAIFTQYFYDGLLVTSAADWSMPDKFPFEARAIFNFENATVTLTGDRLTVYTENEIIEPSLEGEDHFVAEMKEFLSAALDGKCPETSTPESVYESMLLAHAEIEAALSLKSNV